MIEWAWIVPQVRNLFMACPLRSKWGESEFNRLVLPPLALGQWCGYAEAGELKAWASWAYFTPEIADEFKNRTRKVRPEEWKSGAELWIMDMIAKPGYLRLIGKETKRRLSYPGNIGHFTRHGKGRVGYVQIAER